jgi:hypothetical protein
MTLMLLVVLTTTHLEDLHLVVTTVGNNSTRTLAPSTSGAPNLMLARANGEDLVDGDFGTNVCRYLFYFEFFASSNFVLFAAGFYDRVHDLKPLQMLRKFPAKGTADYTQDTNLRQKLFTNGRGVVCQTILSTKASPLRTGAWRIIPAPIV